jgi:hypothetical protein
VQSARDAIKLNVIKYDQVVIFLEQIVPAQPIKKDGNEKLNIDENTTLSDVADYLARIEKSLEKIMIRSVTENVETSLEKIVRRCLTENVDEVAFDVDDETCKKHELVQTDNVIWKNVIALLLQLKIRHQHRHPPPRHHYHHHLLPVVDPLP